VVETTDPWRRRGVVRVEETPGPTSSCRVDHARGVLKLAGDVDHDSAATVTERVFAAVTAGVTYVGQA
jgi:hypothetical protein